MFEEHFHLVTPPFNMGPDPEFIFLTEEVRESLAVLSYGITARKGFIQLIGDAGTGKTTLLNVVLRWLRDRDAFAAFISNPHVTPGEFLDLIWTSFGLERGSLTKSQMLVAFNQWLRDRYTANQLAVVFVDEAQQLSAEVLEELRLLMNLETPRHKLLQIVLSGQTELEALLERPALRQLRQRITLRCRTAPFTREEAAEYIRHRLRVAGGCETELFTAGSIERIHSYSAGIARLINAICDQSMIEAFCDGEQTIDSDTIERVAREMGLSGNSQEALREKRDLRTGSRRTFDGAPDLDMHPLELSNEPNS